MRSATATSDRDRHRGDRDKESCTPGQMDGLKSPCDSRTPGPATKRTVGLRHHGSPSPHLENLCSTGNLAGAPQSLVQKLESKSLQQLPRCELSSSSSRSLHCLRSITSSGGQSRQPINQVITFPQISAIWASTCRPIRMSNTLRRFKPLSLSVIVESPLTP